MKRTTEKNPAVSSPSRKVLIFTIAFIVWSSGILLETWAWTSVEWLRGSAGGFALFMIGAALTVLVALCVDELVGLLGS
jgi:predicted permease